MIVLSWILFAALGLVAALIARHNVKDELTKLGEVKNGRLRLGRGHVRDESIVAIIEATWLLLGIIYVWQGNEVGNPLVALPLIVTSALLTLSTIMRWRDRLYVMRTAPEETPYQLADRLVGDERRRQEDIARG